jgi:DNA-directed RNA polymerase specialized sigma24 family protein
VVRLSVFDRLTPGRIAVQLDMPLKDVRLHLRNASHKLGKAAAPSPLFGEPAADGDE